MSLLTRNGQAECNGIRTKRFFVMNMKRKTFLSQLSQISSKEFSVFFLAQAFFLVSFCQDLSRYKVMTIYICHFIQGLPIHPVVSRATTIIRTRSLSFSIGQLQKKYLPIYLMRTQNHVIDSWLNFAVTLYLLQVSFVLACLVVIGAAALFYITPQFFSWLIYPAAVLLGFGFSAMFVNAFNFANELIGANKVRVLSVTLFCFHSFSEEKYSS